MTQTVAGWIAKPIRNSTLMPIRNPPNWMWAQACDLLKQAEQLHRQFFRLSASGQRGVAWEPPLDIFEDEACITMVVALPGVTAESLEVVAEDGVLIVRATRRISLFGTRAAVRRIEIPYGLFERRIPWPAAGLECVSSELLNGCLTLRLRKAVNL